MIDELSATADSDSRTFSGAAMAKDRTCCWAVRCKLEYRSLFCWPLSLLFQNFSNPWSTGLHLLLADIMPSNDVEIATMTVSALHTDRTWKVGGAINRSFISAHFSISAYFLTVQTYKRMRLTTRVYGIKINHIPITQQGQVDEGLECINLL